MVKIPKGICDHIGLFGFFCAIINWAENTYCRPVYKFEPARFLRCPQENTNINIIKGNHE